MTDAIQFFKAVADETRLRLVNVLNRRELNVNELMTILDMGQSRISRHLKILSSAGLLSWRRDGLWVFYRAADEGPGRAFVDVVLPFVAGGEVFRADRDMAVCVMEERSRKTSQFFNAIAEDWDRLSSDILGGLDLPGAVAAEMNKGGIAVDLGCGTGHVLERMLEKADQVIGVDGSARMLELARRRLASSAARVSLRIGDLGHLPLRDGEADFAAMSMVLHHLSDPLPALAETRRVLRPGGLLALSDFDQHESEAMRADYGDRWLGFSRGTLVSFLEKAGFSIKVVRRVAAERGLFIHFILAATAASSTGDLA
jgi:ArsR family transcriptional regulator